MTTAQLQEQLAAVEKSAAQIEQQIQAATNNLIATRGAIQMCKHLITVAQEEESKPAE
jgi:septal ring factor EnvC (AmiA/AmiB activator)